MVKRICCCFFVVGFLIVGTRLFASESGDANQLGRGQRRMAGRGGEAGAGRRERTAPRQAAEGRGNPEERQRRRGKQAAAVAETGKIALCDLGETDYKNRPGGLYPGRRNNPPADHLAAGLKIAGDLIRPLNAEGKPDPKGRIVMTSVGMSITNMEFGGSGGPDFIDGCFAVRAGMDTALNPAVLVVNGAQGGKMAEHWTDPNAETWFNAKGYLATAQVTPEQVQVAWVKQVATHVRGLPFEARCEQTRKDFEAIVRSLEINYPNIRIVYFSTRRFSTARNGLSVEPNTYEDAFAVRDMIARQIEGAADLNYDPAKGKVVAPWIGWGPYLWADGTNARSDGMAWENAGAGHPSVEGARKVADMLMAFFKTDPTATPWFLRSQAVGNGPVIEDALASAASGPAPLKVHFEANASDADGQVVEYLWSFDDGTFGWDAKNANTRNTRVADKVFHAPGKYNVRLTVIDDQGNSARKVVPIKVGKSSGDKSPTAQFVASAIGGNIPLKISLDASGSRDDGKIESYEWEFGDGASGKGAKTEHTFASIGKYYVKLTVTDNSGNKSILSEPIVAIDPNHNQPPVARFSVDVRVGRAPLTITFDSDPSYDLEGDVVLHEFDFGDGETFKGTGNELGSGGVGSHTYKEAGEYTLKLKVTDEQGLTGSASARIRVLPARSGQRQGRGGAQGGGRAATRRPRQ